MIWTLIQKVAWAVIAVLVGILVLWAFVPKIKQYHDLQEVVTQNEAERDKTQNDLDLYIQNQNRLRTDPKFVERIAREEIGLAKPGELVFKFVDDEAGTNTAAHHR